MTCAPDDSKTPVPIPMTMTPLWPYDLFRTFIVWCCLAEPPSSLQSTVHKGPATSVDISRRRRLFFWTTQDRTREGREKSGKKVKSNGWLYIFFSVFSRVPFFEAEKGAVVPVPTLIADVVCYICLLTKEKVCTNRKRNKKSGKKKSGRYGWF